VTCLKAHLSDEPLVVGFVGLSLGDLVLEDGNVSLALGCFGTILRDVLLVGPD
jgi:hypothetical protein